MVSEDTLDVSLSSNNTAFFRGFSSLVRDWVGTPLPAFPIPFSFLTYLGIDLPNGHTHDKHYISLWMCLAYNIFSYYRRTFDCPGYFSASRDYRMAVSRLDDYWAFRDYKLVYEHNWYHQNIYSYPAFLGMTSNG